MRDVNTEFSDDKTFENKSKLERTSQEYEVPLSVTSKEESLSYSKVYILVKFLFITPYNYSGKICRWSTTLMNLPNIPLINV